MWPCGGPRRNPFKKKKYRCLSKIRRVYRSITQGHSDASHEGGDEHEGDAERTPREGKGRSKSHGAAASGQPMEDDAG